MAKTNSIEKSNKGIIRDKILEGDDFTFINGIFKLTDNYYKKRGLQKPKKNVNKD